MGPMNLLSEYVCNDFHNNDESGPIENLLSTMHRYIGRGFQISLAMNCRVLDNYFRKNDKNTNAKI